ncbi:MAG: MopE-related protein [Chitinophagales bacterium]
MDGYGSSSATSTAYCTPPSGMSTNNTDCNDANNTIHPGAQEICDANDADEDCDGLSDDGDPSVTGKITYYIDTDLDGYGASYPAGVAYCNSPSGLAANNGDCNDANSAVHPGSQEICDANDADEDCDGLADDDDGSVTGKTAYYTDADQDSYGSLADPGTSYCNPPIGKVTNHTDCNDAANSINPAATELCDANNVDEDCNGLADNNDPSAQGKLIYFTDADLDEYGSAVDPGTPYCHPPVATSLNNSDCNDALNTVHPDGTEWCDANDTDEDCNGLTDDADPAVFGKITYYQDADNDGFGSSMDGGIAYCNPPSGRVSSNSDCNDADQNVNPAAAEWCDANDVDEDCTGLADDNDPGANGKIIYYADADLDGYGSSGGIGTSFCNPPSGVAITADDCNDEDNAVHPGASEVCDANSVDENCDGLSDDSDPFAGGKIAAYTDADLDGYGDATDPGLAFCIVPSNLVTNNDDCNDEDLAINPNSIELCDANNVDENCNGLADNADPASVGALKYYPDIDGDGYGDSNDPGTLYCHPVAGVVLINNDCNDANYDVNPFATELCDANDVDEDCNGLADDNDPNATGKNLYYVDEDSDGHGTPVDEGTAYCNPPAALSGLNDDCDDANSAVYPSATEVCDANTTDEDCDGLADDEDPSATGKSLYYADADEDGYGADTDVGTAYCLPPSQLVSNNGDCNDAAININPGAAELCDANNIDENCNGLIDNADSSAMGNVIYYTDADMDGYGNINDPGTFYCMPPSGVVLNNLDCNDSKALVNPAGTEICDANGTDEDCDGLADDNDPSATGKSMYYTDADNDGYGSPSASGILYCNPPLGKANNNTDCNDGSASIHPLATEFCDPNDVDEDCDGLADNFDPSAIGKVTFYVDADGDTYGSSNDPGTAYCTPPPIGMVTSNTDCADGNFNIHPGVPEICDGIDNNCNGIIDENLNASNPMPAPVISPVGPTSFCFDQSVTLNAQAGFNTYTWSTGKTGQSITANTGGSVTVTVKDANNCYGTSAPVNLTVWDPPTPAVSCAGPTTYCLETPSVLSTIPGYDYQWKKGSAVLTGATNQTYAPTSTHAMYKVTTTDAHGCSKTSDNFSVTVNSAVIPFITVTGGTSICQGQSSILTATAGYSSYLWSSGQTTSAITVAATGNYSVTITDQNGCSAVSLTKTITVNPLPQPVITALGPTSFCDGGSVTLDGVAGYSTYNWSNGKNTQTVNITSSGSYSVTVTNSSACSATSAPVTVTEWVPPVPTITTSTGATTFCANTGVYLSTISGTGYQWQKSSVDIAGATSQNYTPTSTGSYKVLVADIHGCQVFSASFSITILNNPLPVVTGTSIICEGFSTTLSCGTFSGYSWSTGSQAATISPTAAGNYTVTVTDANGCVGTSAPKTTTMVPIPVPVITAQGPIQFCDGGSVTLDAGPGYTNYNWSNSKFTQTNSISASGIFTVTVTNGNGCVGTSAPVTVDEWIPPTPVVTTSIGATTFCANTGVYLTTIAGYSYQWQKSLADIVGATSQNYTPTSGGSYKVVITDIHGCSKTSSALSITINSNPVPVISGASVVCQGSSITLTCGTFNAYSWSTGSTASSISTNTSGSYTVTVTDGNGCLGNSAPKTTTLVPLPTPVITAQGPIQFCDGGSVTLDAGSGYTNYNWSNAKTTQTNSITASGTFTVTVTNANGCMGTSTPVTVDEWIPPTPSASIVGPSTYCSNTTSTYLTTLSGPYSYQWQKGTADQPGATNQNYTPSSSGSYKVRITDVHGCSKTSGTVTVTVNSAPTASISITGSANICSGQTKTITANTGAGLTYQWKRDGSNLAGGATSSIYIASIAGNYTCVVTNNSLCSTTSNTIVITSICKEDDPSVVEADEVSWLLFPNPTNNELHIRLTLGSSEEGNYEVEIRNIIGGVVWSNHSIFTEHTISEDLVLDNMLAGGIYFVIIHFNGQLYHSQFVLTRK